MVALAEHDDGVQRPVELAVPPRFSRWRHTVVVTRLRDDQATRAYAARRGQQGKSSREIRRCLKRAVARQLFKLLERYDRGQVEILRAA